LIFKVLTQRFLKWVRGLTDLIGLSSLNLFHVLIIPVQGDALEIDEGGKHLVLSGYTWQNQSLIQKVKQVSAM